MGKKNEFHDGKVSGNKIYLNGKIPMGMMSLKYEIQGDFIGDKLNLNAKTNMGNFNLQGEKIE